MEEKIGTGKNAADLTEKVRKRAGSIAAVVDPGAAEAGRVEVCGEGEVTAAAAAVCSCECRSLCLWAEPNQAETHRAGPDKLQEDEGEAPSAAAPGGDRHRLVLQGPNHLI